MRKITLFLMSLFLTVGAMAQVPEPILELTAEQIGTTYPYQLSDEDANKVFGLTDLTVAVRINTAAVSGRKAFFATSDPTKEMNSAAEGTNSRYVAYGMNGADVGYLASWRSGDRFTGKTGSGIVANANDMLVVYVINPTQKTFKVYVNGTLERSWDRAHNDGFMSGYEIATPGMVKADHSAANIYIGGGVHSGGNGEVFNGTITGVKVFEDALSAEQIAKITFPAEEEEPAEVVVNNVEDLNNNKVYNLITTRGWLIYNEANAGVVASTASYGTFTTGKDVEACQWAIYKSEKNKYYLYNIAAAKFVGSNSDEGGRFPFVAEVTNDIQVVKSTTGTEYALVFSTDNYGAINHFNHAAEPGVANWRGNNSQGGLRSLNDGGSAHKVVEVADIAPATLEAIAAAVAEFEADNTTAVAALSEAVTNAQTLFGQITIGDGVGEYTATDEDYLSKFYAIIDFISSIESTKTPTPAEVEAKIDEVNAIIASFVLNMPEVGKYYRIAYDYGGEVGVLYMQGVNSDVKGVQFTEDSGDASIWCYDGALKSYTAEKYLVEHGNTRGLQDVGATVEFSASPRAIGKYCIKIGSFVHANSSNGSYFTDHCGSDGGHAAHDFIIEEVENPTAVENVEIKNEKSEIYDITGRKVKNISKAGIYIINGNKVLVK